MTNLSQKFHDRARESGVELRKLVISLSTGALAIYFLVLTREITPPLTDIQQVLLLASVCFFGLCIFGGIVSWWSDGARFFFLALSAESNQDGSSDSAFKLKRRWTIVRRLSDVILTVAFSGGVLVSIVFIFYRIKL
jgi:hypothetical protein